MRSGVYLGSHCRCVVAVLRVRLTCVEIKCIAGMWMEKILKSYYLLHHVRADSKAWLLACRVPSSTSAGPSCVSAALNPELVAKGQLSSGWRTL